MNQLPFTQSGTFWRGNLHGHSNLSDGGFSVEEVCRRYQESGYAFISFYFDDGANKTPPVTASGMPQRRFERNRHGRRFYIGDLHLKNLFDSVRLKELK